MSNAALFNQALGLHRAGKREEAEAAYLEAARLSPGDFAARCMLGLVRLELGRAEEAAADLAAAIALDPKPVQGHANYALALTRLERFAEASEAYARALERAPGNADLLINRGAALAKLFRHAEALACYDEALARRPDVPEAHYNKANALYGAGRWQEAVASYDRALALRAAYPAAWRNRAAALMRLKRYDDAAADFRRSLESAPNHPDAIVGLAQCAAHACDWRARDSHEAALRALIETGAPVSPLTLLAHFDDPSLHLANARLFAPKAMTPRPPRRARGGKIKLAYLSGDFRDHPVARVAVGLFEQRDRGAFDVFGISFGDDDGSPLRARTAAAFDQFHDVQLKTDAEIAALIAALEIDILVDLAGYTNGARPGVLARRPAPVQVSWLGYPGTMGADFIDYLIADAVVAPLDQQAFYAEKLVHLPCYMPHDSVRPRPTIAPARAAMGLPETGAVFCSFNNAMKITPAVFALWMRLLGATPGAVLWLAESSADAAAHLRREARARGVDPARLVFAPRVLGDEDHLARYLLADMFLDTAPYGAHSTALDALWMGAPVVTFLGKAFAGRVAASLGAAHVAATLEEYERMALACIRNPPRRLGAAAPVFNGERFVAAIEAAYRAMLD